MNLNKVLKAEVFVSKDRKLRVVHLILDFKPLSEKFQNVGHAIRAGDLRLAWIGVSVPRFLAREDIVPVELPSRRFPHKATVPREETTSSRLSFKTEIDQFHLEKEKEEQEEPVVRSQIRRTSLIGLPTFIPLGS